MADAEGPVTAKSLSWISLSLAVVSLVSSLSQTWNYARNIDSVQRNVLRAENLRSCKEAIDVFFQFRLISEQINMQGLGAPERESSAQIKALVYKFGALSTYLANFRDEGVRQRYTALSWEMLALGRIAREATPEQFQKAFDMLDRNFTTLNEDCMLAAQSRLL